MSTTLLKNIQDQIKAKLAERDSNQRERDVRQAEVDNIVKLVEDEKRGDLNDKESLRFNELRAQLADIDTSQRTIEEDLDGLTQREADLKATEEARQKAADAAAKWSDPAADARSVAAPARVRNEARTYNPDAERRGVSFFRDVYAHRFFNDPDAGQRLDRHVREARLNEAAGMESRAVGTGAFAGLTVPQYLTELAAPLARAGAPTVAICNRHPLPADGMTVNISRITTGTAVSAQTAEGDAVDNTDADDTLLSPNVRTYAGQQDVSRQAIERGTGIDDIVIQDLVRAYWTKLDNHILNGTGSNGQHPGIIGTSSIVGVTFTDTSPTAAELYPKFADLIQQVQSGVFAGITHWIMHPRRWWWYAKELSSTFPLVTVPQAGPQQVGTLGGSNYQTSNPSLLGLPVVLDANIPTTASTDQDVILGVTAPELHLWHDDGAPLLIRAEESAAGTLQVKFVVYQYSAFTAGRYPGAHGKITGAGLTTPTF